MHVAMALFFNLALGSTPWPGRGAACKSAAQHSRNARDSARLRGRSSENSIADGLPTIRLTRPALTDERVGAGAADQVVLTGCSSASTTAGVRAQVLLQTELRHSAFFGERQLSARPVDERLSSRATAALSKQAFEAGRLPASGG